MTRPHALLAVVVVAAASGACQFFVGVTPCLDDKNACAKGEVCDETVGICAKPKPPPPPPPPPPPTPGTCADPLPLTLGTDVKGDTTGITSALKSGKCQGGDAGELVYGLTLDHNAHLHAEVRPAIGSQLDVQIYARHDDCTNPFDEFDCADEYPGGVPEQLLNFDVKAGQKVFVVIDGFNVVDVGQFTLNVIEVYDIDGACDAADTTKVCPRGERCESGKCTGNVPGDVCTSALRLEGSSGTVHEDTSSLQDDIEAGVPCVGPSFTTPASDIFYVVNLAPNATLDAVLTPAADIDQGLYLQSACPTPTDGSCLAFADGHSFGGTEELVFKNTGAAAQDFYLVVDGFTETQNGPFTVQYTITP